MDPLYLQSVASLDLPDEESLWELYHENSKVGLYSFKAPSQRVVANTMKQKEDSFPYDGYPKISLPAVENWNSGPLNHSIKNRRSALAFLPQTISLKDLSIILQFSFGVTDRSQEDGKPCLRAIPSGGALYPLDLYLYISDVEELAQGIYYYNVSEHQLSLLRPGNFEKELKSLNVNDNIVAGTSVVLFITAFFERSTFKYGERGYRFCLMEAGHLAQNINLVATDLDYAVLNVGGFFDRKADRFLGIDGIKQSTIYLTNVGGRSE